MQQQRGRDLVSAMAAMAAMLLVASFAATPAESAYTLKYNYAGYNFFDNFDFWTQNDPTHGYVNYVDRNTAQCTPNYFILKFTESCHFWFIFNFIYFVFGKWFNLF
jgi:hypothetical protein